MEPAAVHDRADPSSSSAPGLRDRRILMRCFRDLALRAEEKFRAFQSDVFLVVGIRRFVVVELSHRVLMLDLCRQLP